MPVLLDIKKLVAGDTIKIVPPAANWRALEFQRLDGTDAIQWSGREFIAKKDTTGLDIPPRELVTESYPGLDGERLEEIRTLSRDVVVALMVGSLAGSTEVHRGQLQRIKKYLDYRRADYVTNEGTFDLVAVSPWSRRYLRCTYVDGYEGDYSADVTGATWQRLALHLRATNPYWRGERWSTPVVSLPKAVPFLSDDPADHPWGLSTSVVIGENMPVTVGGDIDSPAIIELDGPAASTHITSDSGLDVLVGPLAADEHLFIDSGRQRRVLVNGARAWKRIIGSPKWEPLPPGQTAISIELTGADDTTTAQVYGDNLYETAFL